MVEQTILAYKVLVREGPTLLSCRATVAFDSWTLIYTPGVLRKPVDNRSKLFIFLDLKLAQNFVRLQELKWPKTAYEIWECQADRADPVGVVAFNSYLSLYWRHQDSLEMFDLRMTPSACYTAPQGSFTCKELTLIKQIGD